MQLAVLQNFLPFQIRFMLLSKTSKKPFFQKTAPCCTTSTSSFKLQEAIVPLQQALSSCKKQLTRSTDSDFFKKEVFFTNK